MFQPKSQDFQFDSSEAEIWLQVGTELGQAQLKLGFDFTLIFFAIKIWPATVEISPKICWLAMAFLGD